MRTLIGVLALAACASDARRVQPMGRASESASPEKENRKLVKDVAVNLLVNDASVEAFQQPLGFGRAGDKAAAQSQQASLSAQHPRSVYLRMAEEDGLNEIQDWFYNKFGWDKGGTQGLFTQGDGAQEDDKIVALFKEFDANGDGFIQLEELQAALDKAGQKSKKTEEIFKKLDTNNDSQISLEEFKVVFNDKARLEKEVTEEEERLRLEKEQKETQGKEKARLEKEKQDADEEEKLRVAKAEQKEAEEKEKEKAIVAKEAEEKEKEEERLRLENEKKEAEEKQTERARLETEQKEAEETEKARLEKEKKEAEEKEKARLEKEKKEAEEKEKARLEKDKKEAEEKEKSRLEKEKKASVLPPNWRIFKKMKKMAWGGSKSFDQDFLEFQPYYDMKNMPNNLYKNKDPFVGKVKSVTKITGPKSTGETYDIVIDHGGSMPYIEGQSYGVIPPGVDAKGKPNKVRLYSIASSRYGDDMTGETTTLCVRRATYWCPELKAEDPAKKGVCSNYLCDAKAGDLVKLTGPSGKVMLLPEDKPETDIIMVATGTGIAPMRAFLRRIFTEKTPYANDFKGLAWLFLGVANTDGLLYDEEWKRIERRNPDQFRYDVALSREQKKPEGFLRKIWRKIRFKPRGKMYIQDRVEQHANEIFERLDNGAHIYFCGLKGMMPGIQDMLKRVAKKKGLNYDEFLTKLKKNGQWHVEVY